MTDTHTGQPKGGVVVTDYHPEGIRLGKKCAQQFVRQGMARAITGIPPEDRNASQGEVTKRIQHLVPNRLVTVPQPARRQHAATVHNDRIRQCTAKRKTIGAHFLDVALAAEGTAVAQFAHKGTIRHVQRLRLMADRFFVELDCELDLENVCRTQRRRRTSDPHCHRPQDLDCPHRRGQLAHAAGKDTVHEWCSTAIEDRHFRAVNLDQRIMHATPGQSRHHMFYRGDFRSRGVAQLGAQRR